MREIVPTARILVGDDETQIRRLVRDTLKPSGYAIDVTRDGREVLERYQTGSYSLLILDTMLVQASGLEVVMKIRDRGDGVPIILMFGPRTEPDRVEPFGAIAFRPVVNNYPIPYGRPNLAVILSVRFVDDKGNVLLPSVQINVA